MKALKWDYSTLASGYDDRADYDGDLIELVVKLQALDEKACLLDVGAGTGKLTKILVSNPFQVIASEPNSEMRRIGQINVKKSNCEWRAEAAENLSLPNQSIDSVWFGSSFNVIEHKTFFEKFTQFAKRESWITCMWNHRNLEDPIQSKVEEIIKSRIADYNYGSRREDPSVILNNTGLFGEIIHVTSDFEVTQSTGAYFNAWKSHGTLRRQCNSEQQFNSILDDIQELLRNSSEISIPFTTKIWTTKRSTKFQAS